MYDARVHGCASLEQAKLVRLAKMLRGRGALYVLMPSPYRIRTSVLPHLEGCTGTKRLALAAPGDVH